MKKESKNPEFTKLKRLNTFEPFFSEKIEKLFLQKELTFKEKTYLLSCAITFLKEYNKDKRMKGFLEFAYLIILKYSIQYNDYEPLNDISYNLGFYPISKSIYKENKISHKSINNILYESSLEKYKRVEDSNQYFQTFEQAIFRKKIEKLSDNNISFVAPTSYGKSSLIIEILQKNKFNKAAIIVPSKSLLRQTYRAIKKNFDNIKIVLHDDMYKDEKKMIGILTQERAYRLLMRNYLFFDLLFIDEAHNIFEKGDRGILLSRVIRTNKIKNPNSKTVYLSPLINNSNNLKVNFNRNINNNIVEFRINYNLKEPNYYYYECDSLKRYIYNRFNDEFYEINDPINTDYKEYIIQKSKNKNLIYLYRPRNVQDFTSEFYPLLNAVDDNQINEIIEILKKYVHNDYIGIEYLQRGIVYLHGKLPTILKEYLEYKFSSIDNIKYLIANTVVFEGMNFPIESLFILNTYSLSRNKLINLVGRVNRLNNVFSKEKTNLKMLMPSVHFVGNKKYQKKASMKNKMSNELRSSTFEDTVKNPTLENFDPSTVNESVKKELLKKKSREDFLFSDNDDNETHRIKKLIIQRNIVNYFTNIDIIAEGIIHSISNEVNDEFYDLNIIDKIYFIFIKNINKDFINEKDIKRLKEIKTRQFYKNYIERTHWYTMNQNINYFLNYFEYRIKVEKNPILYIGRQFGDRTYSTTDYQISENKVYIDLNDYQGTSAINIAIIKLKIENDFISYKISSFVLLLKDLNLINEDEYNLFIYGTTDKKKIDLLKIGLNVGLIKNLEEDKLLDYLNIDDFGNLSADDELFMHIDTFDDFKKFQIKRFL